MSSIFQGLELAKRALLSHQYSLTTAGHNIANASTPGYSRQRVQLTATDPFISTVGAVGTGVRVATVRHVRDLFLTGQYRQTNDELGRWTAMERGLREVENVLQEPSDIGFNAVLSEFFASWQTLSQNPESSAARAAVREQAATLGNTFHQLSRRLTDLERAVDRDVSDKIAYVNQVTVQVANLNREITRGEVGGQMANDLRDRRDRLIDELSQVVNVSTLETTKGAARVFIGAMEIVGEVSYTELDTRLDAAGSLTHATIIWKDSALSVNVQGGEIGGLLETRDQLVPAYRSMLDDLASAIISEVNALHTTGTALDGTTGNFFFDPMRVTAADISLDSAVMGDLNKIAASQSGAVGDNANAIAIANLQNLSVLNGNVATFADYYAQIVSSAGRRSAEAIDARTNAEMVVEQVEMSRQSVQGVSLDEEMADLIKAQHAYDAAARVITTIDHALDTLINGMGIGL
ncbi:MAG TPA: flagellar hook-associated protein FlgK [Acidobacteriota bacterium]|nr:flagellar hook-associated protein FlgK [Acidobacteriota bacterium]